MKKPKHYEGFSYLLNIDKNAKTIKGQSEGYMTAILYLAPHTIADKDWDLCPYSTKGCRAGCLYTAGHGAFDATKKARIARTRYFLIRRSEFMMDLTYEISKFVTKAFREGLTPVVRLNGTSDIDWNFKYYDSDTETWQTIFEQFPDVQFYDYTKDMLKLLNNRVPNYHLTFSYHENILPEEVAHLILNGYNVAIVFDDESHEKILKHDLTVIDGDAHDLRFLDEKGMVVALKAKGKARKDKTGFVVRN